MQSIILASQSPRRQQLLSWAEIPFDVLIHDTDESFPSTLEIEEVPVYIASQKALAVRADHRYSNFSNRPILAADTIVVLDDRIIGKPVNKEDAVNILRHLSARQHQVITGVCILHGEQEIKFSDVTEVTFHPLTDEQIEFYVEKYKPYDKAGSYAIQEWIGVVGIRSIHGDFYNVMGLPVSRVVHALHHL